MNNETLSEVQFRVLLEQLKSYNLEWRTLTIPTELCLQATIAIEGRQPLKKLLGELSLWAEIQLFDVTATCLDNEDPALPCKYWVVITATCIHNKSLDVNVSVVVDLNCNGGRARRLLVPSN